MFLEDAGDLLLDVVVGAASEGDPLGAVAGGHLEAGEVLDEVGQFGVAVVLYVKIRVDDGEALADLTERGVLAVGVVVVDDVDDGLLDFLSGSEGDDRRVRGIV